MKRFITAESVTEGHPDKVCDKISDSVLDELIKQDPSSRVACETCVTTGFVLVMGEVTTKGYADIEGVARRVIKEIGYDRPGLGFDYESCSVMTMLHGQSEDIALGVDNSLEEKSGKEADRFNKIGAGDQGMMYGFACRETESLMPMPIDLAHKLTMRLAQVRKSGALPYLRPDGKSQVTVEYQDGRPVRVDTVVVSAQHDEEAALSQIQADIKKTVIAQAIPSALLDKNTQFYINPTGKFVRGGPGGDSGLTGRKIIADTYGGYCPHGGGAFSGKDPTKVDRSAAYMARYACKNIVAAGLAEICEMQVCYAIGVARPVSVYIKTYGTGVLPDDKLAELVLAEFDFRPRAIIEYLDLLKPIYGETAVYGHFGRGNFAWEKTDKAKHLSKYVK
ncbi:MAG: methionine adenosyltransferase [Firmicutes bacterium]|nr:methionine adenosyltransferase [Bacillota bacterium]